jgi:peroxiredoxin
MKALKASALTLMIALTVCPMPASGLKAAADGEAKRDVGACNAGGPSPVIGTEAANFSLKDLDGKSVELKAMRGKVVLLDFWATWCPPCRVEMPHLEKLHREFRDRGLLVVGINTEDAKTARSFMKKNKYTFTTLIDGDLKTSGAYGVDSLPTVFVIDREGKIASHCVGAQSEEELREAIKKAGVE